MNLRSLFLTAASSAALLAGVSCGGGGSSGGFNSGGLVTIVTTSVPSATTGVAYVAQLNASVPNAPGTFHVVSGLLPTGLSLDAATGIITGYPRQVGVFRFEVAARDGVDLSLPPGRDTNFSEARQTFTIDVARGLPRILPQTLSTAVYREGYFHSIDVAGGTAPYTFSQVGGSLPSGISVSSQGHIGAFPTQYQVAPYSFTVQVMDAMGLIDTATLELTVVIKPLIILTTSISGAARFFPYSVPIELASSGGGAPYAWSQVFPLAMGETDLGTIGMSVTPDGRVADTGGGPTVLGTFLFTARVIDEAGQIAVRQFSLTVNPGPVLTLINPKFASQAGTFTATGLNFQSGARLVLKPGPTEVSFTPTFVNSTTLTFPSTFPKPSPAAGPIDVRVVNPDGGFHTLPAGLVLPAANISFGNKGFLSSTLSSAGMDVGDIDGDRYADIVHCGHSGYTVYSGSVTSSAAGLILHRNLGTPTPTFSSLTLDGGSWFDVRFADLDLDGDLDIVAASQTQIRTWRNNGAGTFTAWGTSAIPSLGSGYPSEMAIGRFNNDAVPDVAIGVGHWPTSNLNGRVYVFTGNATTGVFTNTVASVSDMPQTYGVNSVAAIDSDGDGRDEVMAGIGMNNYQTNPALYGTSLTTTGMLSSGWSSRGSTMTNPYYGSTTGMDKLDFLGNGGRQLVQVHSGSPNYNHVQTVRVLSGSGLTNELTLPTPGNVGKCITPIDGDFDPKIDFALTIGQNPGQIVVYRGSTQAVALTLDPSVGTPTISQPRTGRIRAGDLNGDGMPDLVATTSYWAVNGMAANYGSTYQMNNTGNGGSMGIVWYLNTSN